MQITLRRLTFDGLGPFREEQVFEFPSTGVTYVYAPNGRGKTATIDLLRWLIRGPLAIEKNEFRSLKQKHEKNVINHHRFRNMKGGTAEAILEVEGRGRYRIQRDIPWAMEPSSELTVEEERDGEWVELDEPSTFLSSILPHERLGFNLLTGEHITEFVQQLNGPVVKRSVERLLQNPELVSLHDCLEGMVEELEKEAAAEDRAKGRRLKLLDKRSELQQREESYKAEARTKENEEHEIQRKIETLNQELASLEDLDDLESERAELRENIDRLEQRVARERKALCEVLTPSWRTLLVAAARKPLSELLATVDEASEAHEAWEQDMGEVGYLENLLEQETCYCGTEMDEAHRESIRDRIYDLEAAEPEVPELAVDPWTLRGWATGAANDDLAGTLEGHQRRLAEALDDLTVQRERLATVESKIEETTGDERQRIERKLKAHKMKINALRDAKSKDVRNQLDALKELNKVKERLANTEAAPVDGPMLTKARAFHGAIRQAIDGALPRLRQQLLDRTQDVFDTLFQKDADFQIALSEGSMIPHVVREVDGEQEPMPLSEGEKTRLGLALLFALRDVASERPFLFLDAPFSTLDDVGVHRLLELIRDHEGQVVVFTKDAFPSGRRYDAVREAKPTVYRMDWLRQDAEDTEGATVVEPAKVDVLRLQEA